MNLTSFKDYRFEQPSYFISLGFLFPRFCQGVPVCSLDLCSQKFSMLKVPEVYN